MIIHKQMTREVKFNRLIFQLVNSPFVHVFIFCLKKKKKKIEQNKLYVCSFHFLPSQVIQLHFPPAVFQQELTHGANRKGQAPLQFD